MMSTKEGSDANDIVLDVLWYTSWKVVPVL